MKKYRVLIIDSDEKQGAMICTLLKGYAFDSVQTRSLEGMEAYLDDLQNGTVIFNLDNIPATNKTFRELKVKNPGLNIMALSKRQFHPELEEALREYISVCLGKPLDTDELIYWLNSVAKNSVNLNGRP